MWVTMQAYPLMDHVLVRMSTVRESSDHTEPLVDFAVVRELYLPESGNEQVDLVQAMHWAIVDVLGDLLGEPTRVERADTVSVPAQLVRAVVASLREGSEGLGLLSTKDSPQ